MRRLARLFAAVLLILTTIRPASAVDTLRVGAGARFAKIGAAIQAAKDGDAILIAAGRYPEKGLVIDKRISIQGEAWPVIDAEGGETILEIRADGVSVRGLVLHGVGVNYLRECAGIWLTEASGAVIEGNRFENDFFGVYGSHVRRATVRGNVFEGLRGRETANGNGVHFWKSDSLIVDGNSIRGHRDGIYLEFTGNSVVTGNTCEANVRYGLHFMFSHGNSFLRNTFRTNGSGVAVMYSREVLMRENVFERNWGAASYGLLLKSITGSRIENNRFERNTVAIFQEGSSRLSVSRNLFKDNGWALRVVADCDDNDYTGNRFSGNTFDLAYNASSETSNRFEGNQWDHYQGWDLDRDGIGDIPHRPVDLFPAIMQNHPQAMVLLRSHFVTLLNVLEKMFPTLSPASLEDKAPLMPTRVRGGKES